MEETPVVTCFLLHRDPQAGDRVLILRRSDRVGTYRGRWAGVSGYLEAADPLDQAYTELQEEAGLSREDVELLAAGRPLAVDDPALGRRWLVHPFLFLVRRPDRIATDWEHVDARWVPPDSLARWPTVPSLADALAAVYPLEPHAHHGGEDARPHRPGR
jgi:ADP-ribose pyrophosphatase YjhB (NUDIX family)